MFEYFRQVRAEMRHVTWPSRQMTIVYTAVVIAVSIGIAVYLGVLDYVFSLGLQHII